MGSISQGLKFGNQNLKKPVLICLHGTFSKPLTLLKNYSNSENIVQSRLFIVSAQNNLSNNLITFLRLLLTESIFIKGKSFQENSESM